MWLAIDAVKKGEADVAVSAGNTGALMVMAKLGLKTMAGIERPAIAALWPTLKGESVVLDLGASIGADAQHLVDLAVMGSAMARVLLGLERPTVGLLNIGVEEQKGLEEVREAGQMLRDGKWPHFAYAGFVEGDDIGKGTVDVVVTEGFAGNIALKAAEGTARQMGQYLKTELSRTWITKLGYLLARSAFRALADKMDPRKSNGGVFLGLNGIVIKSHGGTDAEGFAYAIDVGYDLVRHEMLAKIGQSARAPSTRSIAPSPGGGNRIVTMLRSVVLGCGSYLPSRVLDNAELSRMVDTSDEWIIQRTGIRERRIAAEGETTSDMAIAAARAALASANVDAQSIDLIVLATSTPDNTFPASAVSVQAGLGITHGAAFDVQAVCSGFVFGLATVDGSAQDRAIQARAGDRLGDLLAHPRLDRSHNLRAVRRRRRCGGDRGAAAGRDGARTAASSPPICARTAATRPSCYVDGGPSSTGTVGHLRMEGRAVFKHAVAMITDVIEDAFKATGYSAADIDWFVPHQANKRIIDDTAKKLGLAPEKVVLTVDRHGNTSAASIPLALAVAVADGRIKRGDLVMLEAMGGGFTWGSVLLRW